jgi:glycosyltransferase involved in cell wall biosynthesis
MTTESGPATSSHGRGHASTEHGGKVPITAIILTQDEERNIVPCLSALSRAADVVIVDSGSRDRTLHLARATRPDVRVFERTFTDFGDQRNWALDHCAPREWVLFVDADEYCDPELLDEIATFIAAPGDAVGGFVAGRTVFLGTFLRRCTLYPSYQLRLLRRDTVRFVKEGHGQRELTEGPLRYLRHSWRHEAFSKGIAQWITRHNVYSSEEVELLERLRAEPLVWSSLLERDPINRRRAWKRLAAGVPGRPLVRFVYLLVVRGGVFDGRAGWYFCLLRLAHELHISVKRREWKLLRQQRSRSAG